MAAGQLTAAGYLPLAVMGGGLGLERHGISPASRTTVVTGVLFPQATMLAAYLCVIPSQLGAQYIGTAGHVKNHDRVPLAPLFVPMFLNPLDGLELLWLRPGAK
jgi:hypothetical protein